MTTFISVSLLSISGEDGERYGRGHGSGIQWQQGHYHHGTYCQGRQAQNIGTVFSSLDRPEMCQHDHYREGKAFYDKIILL